jgi:hypothetical protein
VEDERTLSNGVRRSKQDERQMGMTDKSRMKSESTPVDIWVHTEGANLIRQDIQ